MASIHFTDSLSRYRQRKIPIAGFCNASMLVTPTPEELGVGRRQHDVDKTVRVSTF